MQGNSKLLSYLQHQRQILSEVISKLEEKNELQRSDFKLYDNATQRVEKALRQLQKKLKTGL